MNNINQVVVSHCWVPST